MMISNEIPQSKNLLKYLMVLKIKSIYSTVRLTFCSSMSFS